MQHKMEIKNKVNIIGSLWVLVIRVILITVVPVSSINEDFNCPDVCDCSFSADERSFKMFCGEEGAQLHEINVDSKYNVKFECLGVDKRYASPLILPFNKSNYTFNSFTFRNCPLPEGSLVDKLHDMGFEKVNNILFKADRTRDTRTMNFKRLHFKGMNDVIGLDLSYNDISNISEDIFDDMNILKRLNLENNKIRLDIGLLKALSNLESLNLSENGLVHIPDGFFKYLKSLKELNLNRNFIKDLANDSFEGLTILKTLYLGSNKMSVLPVEIFYNLPDLSRLNISDNNIKSFPEELFIHNRKLELLDLSQNEQIHMKIPSKLIHDLQYLSHFRLNKCKLSILPESFFWNLTKLENISLESNSLTMIPENLFKDQTSLVFLELSDNEIKQISNLAFRSLAKLETLKMDNNKMNHISEKIFEHLVSLKELSMKNNNLREIDVSAFITTRNIERIDFSYNKLTMLEGNELLELAHLRDIIEARSPFHCLDKLKYLNLSHNWVTEIYSDWKYELLALKHLDLTYNNISCVMFGNLNFLANGIEIDLRHNNISTIDFKTANHYFQQENNNEVSSTLSARVLIDDNPIHCDCLLYGFIRYLEGKLNPQVKNVVRVEAGPTKCASPKELVGKLLTDLKEDDMLCPLDEPESSFSKMCPTNCTCFVRVSDRSIIVNCSNSNAKLLTLTLPNVEPNHLNCTEVHFERNHLKDLSLFSSKRSTFDQITKLYVAGNNISYLNIEDIPSRIEHLDLSNNLLTHINRTVVDALNNSASLKHFWISGNPLQCDKENLPLFSFLDNNYVKVKDYANITCADGNTLSNFMKEQMAKSIT